MVRVTVIRYTLPHLVVTVYDVYFTSPRGDSYAVYITTNCRVSYEVISHSTSSRTDRVEIVTNMLLSLTKGICSLYTVAKA